MPHRLGAHELAGFSAPEVVRPRLSARSGARISGVSLESAPLDAPRGLVFRAEGPDLEPGIWRERADADAQLLVRDEGAALLEPRMVQGTLVVKRAPHRGAPSAVVEVAFAREGQAPLLVPGQSYCVSGDGRTALVADVVTGALTRVDLASLARSDVACAPLGDDPQRGPLLSLDESGEEALLMTKGPLGVSLSGVSLATGARTEVLGGLPSSAWVSGAFLVHGGGVLALVSVPDAAPLTLLVALLVDGGRREVMRVAVSAPPSVPALLSDEVAVLPLSLKAHPLASYGPVDLVAVSLAGKAQERLTRTGDVKGQARALSSGGLVVEGGHSLLWVSPKRA